MLRSILRLAVVYIAFYITAMVPSFAAQRVALVLGNSNYESVGLLRNPANDATALAEALKRLQFSVTLAMDLDKSSFESALADFSEASSGAEIALIYYAGHAIEMNGQNFLIPTDAKLTSDSRVAFETVSLDDLLNAVGDASGLKMIILDSCRNNPFVATMKRKAGGRAVGRGLAVPKEPDPGLLISFAAAAGTVASDGEGEHSPYTRALLNNIETPGLELNMLLRKVRAEVKQATEDQQTPFDYGSLPDREIYLSPAVSAPETQEQKLSLLTPTDKPADRCRDAGLHWNEIKASGDKSLLEEHVRLFGECAFATFARKEIERLNREGLAREVTNCDLLAASPTDERKLASAAGVEDADIVAVTATSACSEAMEKLPSEPRFIYQHARALQASGDFTTALDEYRKAADLGYSAAMRSVGEVYDYGRGVPADYAEAMKWYRKAVDAGSSRANLDIGWLYENGQGVPVDYVEAMKWYRRAADAGVSEADLYVGILYASGNGVATDHAEAMKWYRRSADAGFAGGYFRIGTLYEGGLGVPLDYAEAMKWYREGVVRGATSASVNLGKMSEEGKGVPVDYAEAMKWYVSAAEAGDDVGMALVGDLYDKGKGVPQDQAKALEWYLKAAAKDNPTAAYNVGYMYEHGEGTAVNPAEALKWYLKAANQGLAQAQYSVGAVYNDGIGVAVDFAEAMKWYRKAAEGDDASAIYRMARLYDEGKGVPVDDQEALRLYLRSVELNDTDSMRAAGIMYFDGEGVARNNALAARYFVQALENGNEQMQTDLKDKTLWSSDLRKEVQRILKDKGFYNGPLDGAIGRTSSAAIDACFGSKK